MYIRKHDQENTTIQKSSLRQIAAKDIDIGFQVAVYHDNKLHWATVHEIKTIADVGAQTLYTMNGRMMIENVLCSNFGNFYPTFGSEAPDTLPYTYFSTHRVLYQMLPYKWTITHLKYINDHLIFPILRLVFKTC